MTSSGGYQCVSPLSQFSSMSPNEFQTVLDDESPISMSVKNFVANFEHQHRQVDTTSPRSDARPPKGSSKAKVTRLRTAHLRSASEDFSRGTLVFDSPASCSSPSSSSFAADDGASPCGANAVQPELSGGRSVAELRAVLQKSARLSVEGETENEAERMAWRRTREVEAGFRSINELKAALKQPAEGANETGSATGSPPRLDSASDPVCDLAPAGGARSVARSASKNSNRKPSPKVLPKPNVRLLPSGAVVVERFTRSQSFGNDYRKSNVIAEERVVSTPDRRSSVAIFDADKYDSNNSSNDCGTADVQSPSSSLARDDSLSRRDDNLMKTASAGEVDSARNESVVSIAVNGVVGDVSSVASRQVERDVVRRHSARSRNSCDSSRTSSNVSVFGSATNVDSILDDDQVTSDSMYSSQADSGIHPHESSHDSSVVSLLDVTTDVADCANDETSSDVPLVKLQYDQVLDALLSAYGKINIELGRIICGWSTCRTALDYVADMYVEFSDVRRYHTDLMKLCRQVSDGPVQYLSLEAFMDAISEKIREKRNELQQAKASVNADMVNMRHLENKVSTVVKAKAADPRHFEKFQVYFDELDKVTQLLLMLSSRLSRLDNSIGLLSTSGSEREMAVLASRRGELLQKLDDARMLKADIDRRSESLASSLASSLDDDECSEFAHLVTERCRLSLQRQEIADWLRMADESLKTLSAVCDADSIKGSSVC